MTGGAAGELLALVTYGAQSKYGADIPLTVVGIVMKVFQIVISVCIGIAVGARSIIGYNYGAGLIVGTASEFSHTCKSRGLVVN